MQQSRLCLCYFNQPSNTVRNEELQGRCTILAGGGGSQYVYSSPPEEPFRLALACVDGYRLVPKALKF